MAPPDIGMAPPDVGMGSSDAATLGAAPRGVGAARGSLSELIGGARVLLFQPRSWARFRLLVDLVALYLASSLALFAAAPLHVASTSSLLAATFPIVVLV